MKTVKDKYLVIGVDFAGFSLKIPGGDENLSLVDVYQTEK